MYEKYEKFDDSGRQVMLLANAEAQRLNHEYIGTEHILLGLLRGGTGKGFVALRGLDIDLREVREEIEDICKSGPEMVIMGRLPLTPRAEMVIEYAREEARNLSHDYVGTEHLLLGLLREDDGIAAQVLNNLGVDAALVREEVKYIVAHGGGKCRADDPAWRKTRRALLGFSRKLMVAVNCPDEQIPALCTFLSTGFPLDLLTKIVEPALAHVQGKHVP